MRDDHLSGNLNSGECEAANVGQVKPVSLRKIWAANSMSKQQNEHNSPTISTPTTLRLSNGIFLVQGNRDIVTREREEFPGLSPLRNLEIYSLVKFPRSFLSPPSVMLSFGSANTMFMIGAEDINCDSFAIVLRSVGANPCPVQVSWKAVGFLATDGSRKRQGREE